MEAEEQVDIVGVRRACTLGAPRIAVPETALLKKASKGMIPPIFEIFVMLGTIALPR